MPKFIGVDAIYQALYDMGAVMEEPETVRRLVIDLEAGGMPRIYIEKFADDEKLSAGLVAGLTIEAE